MDGSLGPPPEPGRIETLETYGNRDPRSHRSRRLTSNPAPMEGPNDVPDFSRVCTYRVDGRAGDRSREITDKTLGP